MKLSPYQWLIGIVLAFGVQFLVFVFLKSDESARFERAAGPVISVAGSLSDYATEADTIVEDKAETVEAEDQAEKVEPEEMADVVPEENTVPTVALEKAQPKKNEKKKEPPKKSKQDRKEKRKHRSREGKAGRRGGGGGKRQSSYAGTAAMSNFKGRVRARIASRARSARGQGTVVIRFTVTANGGTANIRVIRGASAALNNAALRAVRGGFPPIPPGLPRRITFSIPITFR